MKRKRMMDLQNVLFGNIELLNTRIRVDGNSMFPTLMNGDEVNLTTKGINNIKIGDIIVYKIFITHFTIHRVVDIVEINGIKHFKTKGDNNSTPDPYWVKEENIIGIVIR